MPIGPGSGDTGKPLSNIDRLPEYGEINPTRLRRIIDQLTRNVLTGRIQKVTAPAGCEGISVAEVCEALNEVIDKLIAAGVFDVVVLVDEFDTLVVDEFGNCIAG